MRVVICWAGHSGYLAACWRALADRSSANGIDLRFVVFPTVGTANAPFRGDLLAGLPADLLEERYVDDAARVAERVVRHRPDVVVIPGWLVPAFTALAFDARLSAARFVLAIDTPRKPFGTQNLRQWLGRVKLRGLVKRVDRAVVPGERGWQYARFLGFPEAGIRRGVYGVDADRFAPLLDLRTARPGGWPRRFLYTGRYEPVKGIDVLLDAYDRYRRAAPDPWPLTCCGKGPEGERLRGVDGVEDRGFVQPADQPALWADCGAFVLASRFDPWPLVVVEACAAGLPVACTEACGSAVELIRPLHNGLTVATGDPADLARGLRWMHDNADRLPAMGRASRQLAAAYSADRWADRWEQMFRELVGEGSGRPSA